MRMNLLRGNLYKLPAGHKVYVAVSGGVDSMVALHYIAQRFTPVVLHYMHADSPTAKDELNFVTDVCKANGYKLEVGVQNSSKPSDVSQEEHWRNGRYDFFHQFYDCPVVSGHTLDDAVEWYIFTALNGSGRYMRYRNQNVIRPFLIVPKQELIDYAEHCNVAHMHDATNDDPEFAARNRIRHNIVPEALKINPGLRNQVKKRIIEIFTKESHV